MTSQSLWTPVLPNLGWEAVFLSGKKETYWVSLDIAVFSQRKNLNWGFCFFFQVPLGHFQCSESISNISSCLAFLMPSP